ncbi:MAG: hypothetical protein Q9186_003906 [Xanthomendoza sp. 1 TL-2023]
MNHLPWPHNDDIPPFEIPYICGDLPDFDGLDFLDYPIRKGWSTPEDRFRWIPSSPNLTGQRAQNRLFFGLLQVLLGRLFNKKDYIRLSPRSNRWIIDTESLPSRSSELVRSVNDGSIASTLGPFFRDRLRETWNSAFFEAKLHFEVLDSYLNREDDQHLMLVSSPIPILLQSMVRLSEKIFLFHDDCPAMCNVDLHPSKFPLCRMLDSYWCPAQAGSIYRLYSPSLIHYVSGLPRRHLGNHDKGCSWEGCVANNVNEETYTTQHTLDVCRCRFIGPNPRQVAGLIQSNKIPLIYLRIVAGQPVLSLVAAELGTQYVSLSHVWAGGLGNFRENKLPTCQLLRLYELVSELDAFRPTDPKLALFQLPVWLQRCLQYATPVEGTFSRLMARLQLFRDWAYRNYRPRPSVEESPAVCFWMDTLCIPVRPEDRPLRIKAINNMNLIYAAAERCLVLDPELQRISMKSLSPVQINAHVLCCTWLTRSWTFQEARLSRAWFARFADGFYNPNSQENADLHYHLYSDWNVYKSDAHNLASEMISWYLNMPAMRQMDLLANQSSRLMSNELYDFISIWNQLVSRSTSKLEDVNGILANTLDLSAGEVVALPPDQRMKAILKTRQQLPGGLLFNAARKVADPYSRWVPLYPEESRLTTGVYGALRPSATGFYLDTIEANPVGFLVDPSVPRYSRIRLIDSSSPNNPSPIWISFNQESDNTPIDFKAPTSNNEEDILAIVYLLGNLRSSLELQAVSRRPAGARFALKKKEGRMLHLVYEYSFFYSHQRMRQFRESEETYTTVYAMGKTEEEAGFHVDCSTSVVVFIIPFSISRIRRS